MWRARERAGQERLLNDVEHVESEVHWLQLKAEVEFKVAVKDGDKAAGGSGAEYKGWARHAVAVPRVTPRLASTPGNAEHPSFYLL